MPIWHVTSQCASWAKINSKNSPKLTILYSNITGHHNKKSL